VTFLFFAIKQGAEMQTAQTRGMRRLRKREGLNCGQAVVIYAKYACIKATTVRMQRATTRSSEDVLGTENMPYLENKPE
jgi:hypothetical protein